MLAAGVGSRLAGADQDAPPQDHPPKCLLSFGGASLLARHIEILKAHAVDSLTLVVGYRSEDVVAEIHRLGAGSFVETVYNPDFQRGSLVSLWTAWRGLTAGADVLFMDADVLYHPDLIGRLTGSAEANCLLMDRDFEDGGEPVKLCLKDGNPVDFRKAATTACDTVGEWPGFLRLSPDMAATLYGELQRYVDAERLDEPVEEVFRDLILAAAPGSFGVEDITGLPWIEIDFPQDVERAQNEILPRLP